MRQRKCNDNHSELQTDHVENIATITNKITTTVPDHEIENAAVIIAHVVINTTEMCANPKIASTWHETIIINNNSNEFKK